MKDKNCGLAILGKFKKIHFRTSHTDVQLHSNTPNVLFLIFSFVMPYFLWYQWWIEINSIYSIIAPQMSPWFPLFVLPVHPISYLFCVCFTSLHDRFCLISFNLKVRHSAPSSSLMVHVLMLHLEKLETLYSFCACLFLIPEWLCILVNALVSPNVWSDVAHFVWLNMLSCWFHIIFCSCFWFHFHCAWMAHLSVFLSS